MVTSESSSASPIWTMRACRSLPVGGAGSGGAWLCSWSCLPASIGDNPSGIDPLPGGDQDERSTLMVASNRPRWHHPERMRLVGHVGDAPMRASPRDAGRRPPSPRVAGYARPACVWGEPGSVWGASPPVRPSGAPAAALRAVGIAEGPAVGVDPPEAEARSACFRCRPDQWRARRHGGPTEGRLTPSAPLQATTCLVASCDRGASNTSGHSSRNSVISAVTVPQPADSRACSEP
jgi:hypothetical protein